MNTDYIQNIRYKLQKRVRRLNSLEHETFHYSLKQFWGFLNDHPIFTGIFQDLERRYAGTQQDAEKIVNELQGVVCDSEQENAALSYFIIKICVESDKQDTELNIGRAYGIGSGLSEELEKFKDYFLEPFYEYIDEQLDDQRAILTLLKRYKHKCEWFQRGHLFDLWKQDTQRGEKNLALHLYEYLHDQGLKFMIEPSSASGKADLISAQKDEEPLIADAKIFDPKSSKGKSYIKKGFHQIYQYTLDYNEPFGYLRVCSTNCVNGLNDTNLFL
jgi:hypothetical protein